ncbi:MAG: M13 family peptidase, partial [Clostridiales bacterium]|nr:M13 family peptidase [Clostridiales bacterium]
HEISHALDVNGAQFDEKGNVAVWWTAIDLARFQARCSKVAAHYANYEAAPGVAMNGILTLNENVADLGGMACVLDAMAQLTTTPNYKLFFTNAAKIWANTATRKTRELSALTDRHSSGNARVNKTLQNFQEFHDTFGVTRGDGMYVEPTNRVAVW